MIKSQQVFNLYKADKTAKKVMDYMTLKAKTQLTFPLDKLVTDLKLDRGSIVQVFKALESFGLGLNLKGQGSGRGTRFESFYTMEELEKTMHDEKYVAAEPVRILNRYWEETNKQVATNKARHAKIAVAKPAAKDDVEPQYNTLILRPGLTISLPVGMSEVDKKRILDFVQIVN